MRKKTLVRADRLEIVYSKKRWRLIKKLRLRAIAIMKSLENSNLSSIVYGSVARGDIYAQSDIDVFLPNQSSSFLLETTLEQTGFSMKRRFIVQATPFHAAKGYIELNDKECVSFPLMKLRSLERDFYRFGGEASLSLLRKEMRVPGVDKRLMLIEPTQKGHVESSIIGREEAAAKSIDASLETIFNRVRVLLHREKVGRTGVFLERVLMPDETFEMVIKKLEDQNPAVRRRLNLR